MSIRVLIADDHRMFRQALRDYLSAESDIEIVGESGTCKETLQEAARWEPDILLLDIQLPDGNGIELCRELSRSHPLIKTIALTGNSGSLFIGEMMKAGARGYVVKTAGEDELLAAIHAVASGGNFLSRDAASSLANGFRNEGSGAEPPLSLIGRREKEVLQHLAQGKSSAEIGYALGISAGTVEVHRRNLRQKLGIHTTAELTRYAIKVGLIDSD